MRALRQQACAGWAKQSVPTINPKVLIGDVVRVFSINAAIRTKRCLEMDSMEIQKHNMYDANGLGPVFQSIMTTSDDLDKNDKR